MTLQQQCTKSYPRIVATNCFFFSHIIQRGIVEPHSRNGCRNPQSHEKQKPRVLDSGVGGVDVHVFLGNVPKIDMHVEAPQTLICISGLGYAIENLEFVTRYLRYLRIY